MTMQPFAVLLVGLLFGPGLGAATLAAYLLEGAAGLPVFTPQGPGGMAQLFGPTGGYLLSYPAAAAAAGAVFHAGRQRSVRLGLGAGLAAELVILVGGLSWLLLYTHRSLPAALGAAVYPFLAGDAVKIVLAALLAAGWARTRARSSNDLLSGDSVNDRINHEPS